MGVSDLRGVYMPHKFVHPIHSYAPHIFGYPPYIWLPPYVWIPPMHLYALCSPVLVSMGICIRYGDAGIYTPHFEHLDAITRIIYNNILSFPHQLLTHCTFDVIVIIVCVLVGYLIFVSPYFFVILSVWQSSSVE